MKALAIALAALLPIAVSLAQEPASRPALEQRAKARQGGFYGISFVERQHEGQVVLEIVSVLAGTDAARLGFRKGDRITAVNGRRLVDGDDFIKMLYATLPDEAGRQMRAKMGLANPEDGPFVTVLRGGKAVRIEGGLAELDESPAVGDRAPDFTLAAPDGEATVTLSKLVGRKPVVLVFGSYT